MTALIPMSFAAGALSTLSPCVLPILPVVLGGAARQHRLAPLALAGGLALSFSGMGLFLASVGLASGIDAQLIRVTSGALLLLFGAVLAIPAWRRLFSVWVGRLAGSGGSLLHRVAGEGLSGQFLLGMLLGLVWSPCAGPALGAAVGMAASSGTLMQAATLMTLFGLGAATPLLLLAHVSRVALRHRLSHLVRWGEPLMGALLILLGLAVVSGIDKHLETTLTGLMPPLLIDLATRY